jgi:hypothetical protein
MLRAAPIENLPSLAQMADRFAARLVMYAGAIAVPLTIA